MRAQSDAMMLSPPTRLARATWSDERVELLRKLWATGQPASRIATWLVRLPFALLAFLLTQNTTHRVAGLGERIEDAGFEILDIGYYLAGTLQLFVAEKG